MSQEQVILLLIGISFTTLLLGIMLGYWFGYKDTIRTAVRKKAGRYGADKYGQPVFVWKIDDNIPQSKLRPPPNYKDFQAQYQATWEPTNPKEDVEEANKKIRKPSFYPEGIEDVEAAAREYLLDRDWETL